MCPLLKMVERPRKLGCKQVMFDHLTNLQLLRTENELGFMLVTWLENASVFLSSVRSFSYYCFDQSRTLLSIQALVFDL